MPSKTAVIKREHLDNIDTETISNILRESLELFTDEVKKRVQNFLYFVDNPKIERFSLKCGEILVIKRQIGNPTVSQQIDSIRDAYDGDSFKTTSPNRLHISVGYFINGTLKFKGLVDRIYTIEYLKYSDFIRIIHNTRNKDGITFAGVQLLLGKLLSPADSQEERKLGIGELDIITGIAVNDDNCGNQSQLILKLAELFGVIPDESILCKIETLKKNSLRNSLEMGVFLYILGLKIYFKDYFYRGKTQKKDRYISKHTGGL